MSASRRDRKKRKLGERDILPRVFDRDGLEHER